MEGDKNAIGRQKLQELMEFFSKNVYSANNVCKTYDEVMQRCGDFMRMDYSVVEISNSNGDLSTNYPEKLLIPEREIKKEGEFEPRNDLGTPRNEGRRENRASLPAARDQLVVNGKLDAQRLRCMIGEARLARCRARFPLPVILYNGKYICRSSTLAGVPEFYGRSGYEYFTYTAEATVPEAGDVAYAVLEKSSLDEPDEESNESDLLGRKRRKDIRLLKALNVGTIIDLMVENKKVKFGMNVTSSEKVDKENRYRDFNLLVLPYPGCEFFLNYRNNNYNAEGLVYDWNQDFVDAVLRVPQDTITAQLNINWNNYTLWDLKTITENYLRLSLKYLQESSTGILLHCISGWDRTPLFVSLLRISLWADGVIHQSLNAFQILYFTTGYDWMLFGHNMPDRLSKGEIIFHFCFEMLKFIMGEEFSVLTHRTLNQCSVATTSSSSSSSSSIYVIRTDSDIMVDGVLLDGESRGSSVSLNSVSSYTSGRSSSMLDTQTCVSNVGLTSGAASNSIAIANRVGNGGAYSNNGDDSVNSLNGNNVFTAYSHESGSSIGCISQDSSNHNTQWSPPSTRTSPVTVPSTDNLRQRQESSSSNSSWGLVSVTGSYRDSVSVNEMYSNLQQNPGNKNYSNNQPQNNQNRNFTSNAQQPASNNSNQASSGNTPEPSNSASTPNANQPRPSQESSTTNPGQLDPYALRRERIQQVRTVFGNCYFSGVALSLKPSVPPSGLAAYFLDQVTKKNQTSV